MIFIQICYESEKNFLYRPASESRIVHASVEANAYASVGLNAYTGPRVSARSPIHEFWDSQNRIVEIVWRRKNSLDYFARVWYNSAARGRAKAQVNGQVSRN